ncbi:MAG: TonB-dependent receptor [Fibrobacterota bacterium]
MALRLFLCLLWPAVFYATAQETAPVDTPATPAVLETIIPETKADTNRNVTAQEALLPDTAMAEYTIIISATRRPQPLRNTPGIAYVLDEKAVADINAKTAADLFRYVPGLDLEAGTAAGAPAKQTVSMNGLPNFHTLVLVDGRRLLSSHFHTGTDISLVPAGSIERVEIVKDASSALYGSDALGGVINLITKRGGSSPAFSVSARRGSQNTMATDLSLTGPVKTGLHHSLFTSWERSDGLPILEANSRSGQMNYEQLTITDRMDCQIGDRGSLGASVHYVEENDLKLRGVLYDSWLFMPGLDLNLKLNDELTFCSQIYYSQWNSDMANEKNVIGSPSFWLTYTGLRKNILTGGGEYAWRSFLRTGVTTNSQALSAGFLQNEFSPVEPLRLLGAVRVDYVDNGDNGSEDNGPVFSPKISLLYRPIDRLGLRAGAGRGFRAPSVQDLMESRYHGSGGGIWRYGSRTLKPEYSTNLNVGVEFSLLRNVTLIGNGYRYRLTDMIALVDAGRDTVYQSRNVPVIERRNINDYGIQSTEFMLHCRLQPVILEAGASASWQESKTEDGDDVLSYPGQNAFGKITADVAAGSFSLRPYLALNAAFNRKSPGGSVLRDYKNLQAGLTVAYAKNYELFFNGVNLLGEEMDVYEDVLCTIKGVPRFEGGIRIRVK